jgi:hypothetical protein
MHFIRKCLLLFLIFFGWMQTVIVNAEEACPSEFTMDGDEIANQAAQCAEKAMEEFGKVSNANTDSLRKPAKMTIEANEKLTMAVNANASQESLSNAEKKVNAAINKMSEQLYSFLNSDNKKECKWALNLLKELFEMDKNTCEGKRGPPSPKPR